MYDVDVEILRRLSEIGYMASFKGFPQEGEEIMEGVYALKPEQVPVQIGLAVAKISAAKYADAIRILGEIVTTGDPDNLTAKCFLGLALKEFGKINEAGEILRDVSTRGDVNQKAVASVYLQD
ncbi:MAG: tetratricopeptide repeat protein [Thiotrichales bacterium]